MAGLLVRYNEYTVGILEEEGHMPGGWFRKI